MDTIDWKKIKLIASDLDGTLLRHGATKCSDEAIERIRQLLEKGIYFMPASGRQFPNLQRLFADTKGELLYLCENGALVFHKEQVVLKKQFNQELALELCHLVIEEEKSEVLISGEKTSYVVPKSQAFVDHLIYDVGNVVEVVEKPEDIKEPIVKVSYFTKPEHQEEVTKRFQEAVGDRAIVVVSGNEWVDFAPLGTSKADAIAQVGEYLQIRPEEMMAFGDNENDRTMLAYVGTPFLMKECNPTMEDVAAFRCDTVEEILEKMLKEIG